MLGAEGLLVGAIGTVGGLVLGLGLSLVLVHVVNRQSFNWSIDLYVPVWRLAALSATLLLAACLASIAGARLALDRSALRAVREDW
jgi:putative ABC transport system permease protein